MSYPGSVLGHLEAQPDRAFVTEVHGERLVPTRGGRLREKIEEARHALVAAGVRAGDRVALALSPSADWIAADLAIGAEGGTTVALDLGRPREVLAAILADARPAVVVASAQLEGDAEARAAIAPAARWLPLGALGRSVSAKLAPPRDVPSDHPLALAYPASGAPRGAIVTRASIEYVAGALGGWLRTLVSRAGLSGPERIFHHLPLALASSHALVRTCLARGEGLFLSARVDDLPRQIQAAAPHWFLSVPQLFERVRAGAEAIIAERPLPVRVLYERAIEAFRRERRGIAGARDRAALLAARTTIFPHVKAAIGPGLVALLSGLRPLAEETQAWFSDLASIPVYQLYGLAEAGLVAIDPLGAAVPGRVGHPLAGTEIRLGEGGELLVRGPQVAPGHHGRPLPPGGWLHTGDRAALDERGGIALLGRMDAAPGGA